MASKGLRSVGIKGRETKGKTPLKQPSHRDTKMVAISSVEWLLKTKGAHTVKILGFIERAGEVCYHSTPSLPTV